MESVEGGLGGAFPSTPNQRLACNRTTSQIKGTIRKVQKVCKTVL